jgi:hypothetical protein
VYKTLNFHQQFNVLLAQSISEIFSDKDIESNKKQDSFASSVGLGNLQLAKESLQINFF